MLAGTDPDGDPLTFTVTSPPAHGTFVGGVYTPAPNYNGPDSIGFTVSDGRGGSDTGTIAITVTPVNDPPVCSPSSFVVPADGQHTGTLVCTDVDDVTLSYEAVSGPAHGVLVLATNGSFTYTPNPGYFGPDVFTFRAVDVAGGSGSAQVSITVTAPPDPNAPTCVATATGRDAAGKPVCRVHAARRRARPRVDRGVAVDERDDTRARPSPSARPTPSSSGRPGSTISAPASCCAPPTWSATPSPAS